MVQRHTIPHLKALIVDNKIPGGQGRGSIMGLPRPLLLKSSIYQKEWAWQANNNAKVYIISATNCTERVETSLM